MISYYTQTKLPHSLIYAKSFYSNCKKNYSIVIFCSLRETLVIKKISFKGVYMKLTSIKNYLAILSLSVAMLAAQSAQSATTDKAQNMSSAAGTAAPAVQSQATNEQTVEGTVQKVVAKKKEIYVTPADGSKKLEFYFPESAQYLKGGQPVGFEALKEGQKVRVTFTRKGKRLNPSKAEILE
jgi:hypothetical protein